MDSENQNLNPQHLIHLYLLRNMMKKVKMKDTKKEAMKMMIMI